MKLRLWAAVGAAALLLSACASETPAASSSTSSSEVTSTSTDAGKSESTGEDATAAPDAGTTCDYRPSGTAAKEVTAPPAQPTVSGQVPITVATGVGELSGTLDADAAPCTANSFAHLATSGYFDGVSCHRLTTAGIFVLQCGDPTGTGRGGPGYQFDDELSGAETYPAGTLAMANAGPGTNGSQFFIVYQDTQLPPYYTVFGSVDADAVATVAGVAEKGTTSGSGDGSPATPVEISSVTVG